MEQTFHATTIVAVRQKGKTAIAGDGQVTFGQSAIMKSTARKVRRLYHGKVVAGFAGSVADARRADHQDVFRYDIVLHGDVKLSAAPAVSERDGDGSLRFLLPDDVAVKFLDDLARRLLVQHALFHFDLFLQVNPAPLP